MLEVRSDYFKISRHLIKNMLISKAASARSMKIILDYISITVTLHIHLSPQREKKREISTVPAPEKAYAQMKWNCY